MPYKKLTQALQNLKEHTRKSDKISILEENAELPEWKTVLHFLTNDFIKTNISTRKLNQSYNGEPLDLSLSQVLEILTTNGSGSNEMVSIALGFLASLPSEQSEILSQVIAKRWTTTVGAKMLNTVYGKGFVPEFGVQLAYGYDKREKYIKPDAKFTVTQKLDGVRAIVFVEALNPLTIDAITITSRTGKPLDGLTELKSDIVTFIEQNPFIKNPEHSFVLDGELLIKHHQNLDGAKVFQETEKLITTKGESTGLTYNIFDMLTRSEFADGKSNLPYARRRNEILNQLTATDAISIVPELAVITKEQIPEWSNKATEYGWEGVMLNAHDGFYETKRTAALLKVKTMKTADLEIVGFQQAIDGQYAGSLQSLIVRIDDEHTVSVGSGLSVEQRYHIWKHQHEYLGKIVEIQYFEETINQNGGKSLRFPVFKGFRFDKTVDDVNID